MENTDGLHKFSVSGGTGGGACAIINVHTCFAGIYICPHNGHSPLCMQTGFAGSCVCLHPFPLFRSLPEASLT